jgi:hypothetical protein
MLGIDNFRGLAKHVVWIFASFPHYLVIVFDVVDQVLSNLLLVHLNRGMKSDVFLLVKTFVIYVVLGQDLFFLPLSLFFLVLFSLFFCKFFFINGLILILILLLPKDLITSVAPRDITREIIMEKIQIFSWRNNNVVIGRHLCVHILMLITHY